MHRVSALAARTKADDALRIVRIGLWLWVLGLGGLGCESGGSDAGFCARYCKRVEECVTGSTTSVCASSCPEYEASTVVNAEFLEAMGPCAEDSACPDILSGDYHEKCFEEAAAKVEPTPALIEQCEELARSDFECGFAADVGGCVEYTKVLKAAVVERMLACADEPSCEHRVACYEGVFQ